MHAERTTKTCRLCGEAKPPDAFNRDKRRPDGRFPYCRECDRERQRAHRVRVLVSKGVCEVCGDDIERPHWKEEGRFCSVRCDHLQRRRDREALSSRYRAVGIDCKACGQTLPASQMSGNGLRVCRRCLSLRRRLEWRLDGGRIRRRNRAYYYRNRGLYREAGRRYRAANRERCRIAARERYQRNPGRHEVYRSISRAYRARRAGAVGSHDGADVIRLWHHQRGECARCGVRFGKRPGDRGYHVDHVTPLARGGSNWPHNLQLLCPTCNTSKGAKTPAAFTLYLRRAGAP